MQILNVNYNAETNTHSPPSNTQTSTSRNTQNTSYLEHSCQDPDWSMKGHMCSKNQMWRTPSWSIPDLQR